MDINIVYKMFISHSNTQKNILYQIMKLHDDKKEEILI